MPKSVVRQLKLPKLGQIGYVVKDVDKTVSYYRNTLGIRPWMLLDERPEPCIEKGKEVHPLLRIALAYMGPVQVELIQVVEGESVHLNHPEESLWRVHHDTVQEAGVVMELIQWHLGALPLPTNRLTFNILCRAGSGSFLKGRVIK